MKTLAMLLLAANLWQAPTRTITKLTVEWSDGTKVVVTGPIKRVNVEYTDGTKTMVP